MARWLNALAVAALLAGGTPAAVADSADQVRARTLFRFADPAITESSGLADGGRVLFTVNDSGDGPRIFAVDKTTGKTVATATYSSDSVVDVEAIAAGRAGVLWVGDTGDNGAVRSSVALYRVPWVRRTAGPVEATRYDLAYPDSAHDAEALLVQPRTGRIFVVSKSLFGGTVFAAPATLRTGELNRLRAVAKAPGLVTDGAFFPDGRHVLLRDYGRAFVYSFPGWRLVGTLSLPDQDQGEAITVSAHGAIYISSEGEHAAVQRVWLPARLERAMAARPGAGDAVPAPREDPAASARGRAVADRVWVTAGIVCAAAGWLYLRGARRRSRRTR